MRRSSAYNPQLQQDSVEIPRIVVGIARLEQPLVAEPQPAAEAPLLVVVAVNLVSTEIEFLFTSK